MSITSLALSQPLISIIIFAFVMTFISTLIYKKFTKRSRVKEIQARQKELRKSLKEYKNDQAKMMEVQKEMMQLSTEQLKMTMKPMLISFLPAIIILFFMERLFTSLEGPVMTLPVIGGINWLWTYIIFGFIFSLILRKLLKA